MLLVSCAEKIGAEKYEDFARHSYGNKMAVFTGWCNVLTLLGFVVSYIVFIKTLCPHILEVMFGKEHIPAFLGVGRWKGELFWASIYTIFIFIPLSIPRSIGTLRYNSLLGVIATIYVVW
jgi:amino acid permease